ncbi:MAG: HAD-IC family P-type ATPase [Dehalococcoidia bacterium]|nr:MAG: HAD-IC family P-type ATPase [Dehalococcoidia bacterium]
MTESSKLQDSSNWYQLPVNKVIDSFSVDTSLGLSSSEAKTRLEKYGYNELKFKKQSAIVRFFLQFRSSLVYVLLLAAIVTASLEMWIDSAVIFIVVIANAIIGFIQEGKAEASMEVLSKMMVLECTVRRDDEHKDIPARELVPGDIVLLEEGDRVPADLRLFYVRDLSIDEAPLTGESVPVDKTTEPLMNPDLPPGDQRCIAFSGTFVSRGAGHGIVVATAHQTEIGRIAELMKETKAEAAPLMKKMAQFTRVLIIAILILAAINLVLGATLGGYDLVYSFLASVSLAVAAIPEGLPAILTIALAAGARAMAKRNALIRRLPAVETLGSATVICSDKTGTLTKSEMTVVRIYCGKKTYNVTGSGYDPTGEFFLNKEKVIPLSEIDLAETLSAGLLCNSAFLRQTNGKYEISGDPTEGALVVSGTKAGITEAMLRLDQIPFGSEHRYMATLHMHTDANIIYVKGSPERVLSMCKMQLVNGNVEPVEPRLISNMVEEMAGDALRVLGLAYKRVATDRTSLTSADLEDMVFIGLQGMIDPPREEAIDAVRKCKRAGIRVIMITGDHAKTAQAIATQLGIGDGSAVLTGEDLSRMSDDELYRVVEQVSVYARVAPVDKFRVTTQLQKRGHIVAMTGDGVNDAPALKAADIGVAMGFKGTDVSREAADMVLVDDNFASIVAAVEEGRHVFENIRKVILYTLPTNGGQAILVIGAIMMIPFIPLFAERLPLEPIQILWINLYDAVALALPLLWEAREEGLLDRAPRNPKEPIANRLFFRKVILVSLIMAGAAFAVYYGFGNIAVSGAEIDETRLTQAQTAAFLTVMMVHIFYLLTSRSLTKSTFKMNPFSNKLVTVGISVSIILHLLLVYALPRVGFNPFRIEPFPAQWWGIIVALGFTGLLLVELEEFAVGKLIRLFPGITEKKE